MELEALRHYLTEEFYWLHEHPELSYKEVETTKRITADLQAKDIRILPLPLQTGVVAEVGRGKPVVAIRCDIDALPIQEKTNLPYCSQIPGRMHGCGHDFHTASILGAAYLLKEREAELVGTVRIIFQPAEEAPGGALKVMEAGGLADVQAIFGMHCTPLFPVGDLALRPGAVTAAVDRFTITFTGKGTHAAHPQGGIDPIVTASAFVGAVQSIVSRNVDPFHANLVSITHFDSGSTWNVIPESAFLEGTMRTLTKEDRIAVKQRVYELAESIAKGYGATVAIDWFAGPPATDNDPDWTTFARQVGEKAGFTIQESPYSLGGEDFAFYQEKVKGAFVQMGTGLSYSNHNPKFKVDPSAILPAAQYMAQLAADAVQTIRKKEHHD